jgi:hypothetical protein
MMSLLAGLDMIRRSGYAVVIDDLVIFCAAATIPSMLLQTVGFEETLSTHGTAPPQRIYTSTNEKS